MYALNSICSSKASTSVSSKEGCTKADDNPREATDTCCSFARLGRFGARSLHPYTLQGWRDPEFGNLGAQGPAQYIISRYYIYIYAYIHTRIDSYLLFLVRLCMYVRTHICTHSYTYIEMYSYHQLSRAPVGPKSESWNTERNCPCWYT